MAKVTVEFDDCFGNAEVLRKLKPGEPFFLIRGQDKLAPATVRFWANEAEKASHVTLIEVRPVGRFGRLYLGGEEKDIDVACCLDCTAGGCNDIGLYHPVHAGYADGRQ